MTFYCYILISYCGGPELKEGQQRMDNVRIRQLCEAEALEAAVELFDTSTADLQFMDISENVVYAFSRQDGKYILRLTHRGGRSRDQVQAQVPYG